MEYFFRFPDWKFKTLTFSYDDGVPQDVRLIEIFKKYGMRGTFNVNAYTLPSRYTPEQVKSIYLDAGMEIACHSYFHPHLEQQPSSMSLYNLVEERRILERMLGISITGFAYPYGSYSEDVVEMLRLSGFKYARTTVATGRTWMPQENWLRLASTCHHRDERLFSIADGFLSIQDDENPKRVNMQMLYVWGHSYEFDRNTPGNSWEHIESFCEKMANKDDIWYATNIEIFRYMEAIKRLEVSPDGYVCYNPSAIDVYFKTPDGKKYVVKAGETITVE